MVFIMLVTWMDEHKKKKLRNNNKKISQNSIKQKLQEDLIFYDCCLILKYASFFNVPNCLVPFDENGISLKEISNTAVISIVKKNV